MEIQERIQAASAAVTPLRIQGGGSKAFLGNISQGEILSTTDNSGIVDYQPQELFIRARAGTPLQEIENLLAENDQMLAFEPPAFDGQATLGGTIACGLSGPARPWHGAARDFVLGCVLINGKGERLKFGGEVIKNVAGYDVSRLQCGAFGTLGVLLELSIRTTPRPSKELTLRLALDQERALEQFIRWNRQPLPLSGAVWHDGSARVRLSGTRTAVEQAARRIGGEREPDNRFWPRLKEHQLPFFDRPESLWRLSLPRGSGALELPGETLIDWGGAQRWLLSSAPAAQIRQLAARAGGHAQPWHPGDFQPLAPALLAVHRRLKQAFDPHNIFNRGRLHPKI